MMRIYETPRRAPTLKLQRKRKARGLVFIAGLRAEGSQSRTLAKEARPYLIFD